MNLEDGDEKDEKGQAKERVVSLYLHSLGKGSTEKCFVHLEIAIYCWIGFAVAPAPLGSVRREH
jgi:hypothetical protein